MEWLQCLFITSCDSHIHTHTHTHTHSLSLSLSLALLEKAEVLSEERSPNHLFIVMSSDRGLCGSIHSNLARTIRPIMEQRDPKAQTSFVCYGDKVLQHSPLLLPCDSVVTSLPHRSEPSCSGRRERTSSCPSLRWARSLQCLQRPRPWPTPSSTVGWSLTQLR